MIFITEDWPFVCADQEFLGFEFGVSDDLVTGGVPNRELKAYYNITKMAYYQTHARWLRDKQQYLHNIYFYSRPFLKGWDKFPKFWKSLSSLFPRQSFTFSWFILLPELGWPIETPGGRSSLGGTPAEGGMPSAPDNPGGGNPPGNWKTEKTKKCSK